MTEYNTSINIKVKNRTVYFTTNKTLEEMDKLLLEAEKHFDFTFFDDKTRNVRILNNGDDLLSSFYIPKDVIDKMEEQYDGDYDDLASDAVFEYIKDSDGNQPVNSYDTASAMLTMIKCYDNTFDFYADDIVGESFNNIGGKHKTIGYFFEE